MVVCPVCESSSDLVRSVSGGEIRAALAGLARAPVGDGVEIGDYDWRRCGTCTLGFADPMRPAGDSFYGWLVGQAFYYPSARWEWPVSMECIGPGPKRVLEIGCGGGMFLRQLSDRFGAGCLGIDITREAVDACVAQGLRAEQGDVETYSGRISEAERFDAVVAFHTLEHVADPLGFVRAAARCLKPGGKVLLSTPYSPLCWEEFYFDPLNYPPHHMTQWNRRAYEALACRAGLSLRLHMPPAASVRARTSQTMARLYPPPDRHGPGRLARAAWLLSHVPVIARVAVRQARRFHVDGRTAPDVVLAEFDGPAPGGG